MHTTTKTKAAPKRARPIDPDTGRPYADPVVGLVHEFWHAWAAYKTEQAAAPGGEGPAVDKAADEYNRLECEVSTTTPTTLRGLVASAALFADLVEHGMCGDYARAHWPRTLAAAAQRLSGHDAPGFKLYPGKQPIKWNSGREDRTMKRKSNVKPAPAIGTAYHLHHRDLKWITIRHRDSMDVIDALPVNVVPPANPQVIAVAPSAPLTPGERVAVMLPGEKKYAFVARFVKETPARFYIATPSGNRLPPIAKCDGDKVHAVVGVYVPEGVPA